MSKKQYEGKLGEQTIAADKLVVLFDDTCGTCQEHDTVEQALLARLAETAPNAKEIATAPATGHPGKLKNVYKFNQTRCEWELWINPETQINVL